MKRLTQILGIMAFVVSAGWGQEAQGQDTEGQQPESKSEEPVVLYWDDLLPVNAELVKERLVQSGKAPIKPGPGSKDRKNDFLVVEELDGYRVRMPGFIVPLEFSPDGFLREVLLVPYHGACIHEPPPPPNQIVYATSAEPHKFPGNWTPVWLTGTMSTEHYLNFLGDAAYTMNVESWELYKGPE